MSLLIKGMEMPKSCMLCPFCVEEADPSNGEMCMVTGKLMPPCTRVRLDDCPLVPVPLHGRLIDADALDSSETDYLGNHLVYLVGIDDAPTIIPAEPFNNLSKPCKDDADFPICTKASPANLGIYKKAEEGET